MGIREMINGEKYLSCMQLTTEEIIIRSGMPKPQPLQINSDEQLSLVKALRDKIKNLLRFKAYIKISG